MAIRDKLRKNAAPLLAPGETIQSIFPAQTTSQYFALISYWIILLKNANRVVVVTDRRILICKSGKITATPVKGIEHELPRSTKIGPATGLWYRFEAPTGKLYVNRRYFKDIETADAAVVALAS
ncbi:MAG: hypothetical protein JWL70_2406 [Acidimicrobiia bacterium]|nr:hypothetical protein [Acidimicrobiia bacterium]